MWRRACLGSPADLANVVLTYGCLVACMTVMVAALSGWTCAIVVGAVVAGTLVTSFHLTRAGWERRIRREVRAGLAALDLELRRRRSDSGDGEP